MNNKRIFLIFELLALITLITGAFLRNLFFVYQSILVGATVFLIYFADKKLKIFTVSVYRLVMLFIFLSMYLGKIANLYDLIPIWDKILHFLSGLILTEIGIDVYKRLGGENNEKLQLFFAFLFAAASAGIWEIYEFTTDFLFSLTSQNNSLTDTMLDIIFGTLASLIWIIIKKLIRQKQK